MFVGPCSIHSSNTHLTRRQNENTDTIEYEIYAWIQYIDGNIILNLLLALSFWDDIMRDSATHSLSERGTVRTVQKFQLRAFCGTFSAHEVSAEISKFIKKFRSFRKHVAQSKCPKFHTPILKYEVVSTIQ